MYDEFDDEDVHIDLTPLIDVIFMLVIFFVMTMTFSKPVLDIVLPKSAIAQAQKKGEELLVAVRADGSVLVDGTAVTMDELPAAMDARPDALLNLSVDRAAPFEAFVKVIDVAKVKREGRFVISTERTEKANGL